MNKKATIQLSANFLVMMIIAIVVFSFSIYFIKKVFTGAETTRTFYDQRIEKEIEKLLDDGSRIAIPFDKKTIYNGEFDTFGIGILNVLNIGGNNDFEISISFKQAFDKSNSLICNNDLGSDCGPPDTWLQTTEGQGIYPGGVKVLKSIKNNEQAKFLLGVGPTGAEPGTYIFDMIVCTDDQNTNNDLYDHDDNPITSEVDVSPDCPNNPGPPDLYSGHINKLYVEVP